MGLIDRLQTDGHRLAPEAGPSLFTPEARQQPAASTGDVGKERFQALKGKIQDLLLKKIDVNKLDEAGYRPLLSQVNEVIDELVAEEHLLLADADRARLIEATAPGQRHLRHPGQWLPRGLDRAAGQNLQNHRALSQRPAPDERHQPHRVARGPPN
jgi:hypothetical protein